MTTTDLLAAALTHQKAGRIDQAASLYETILADSPDHAEALHFSALIALRRGDAEAAVARLGRAAAAAPRKAVIQNDLGAALRLSGKLAEAEAALRRATEMEPGYADAWNNLGIVLRAKGDNAGARAALERAAALKPGFAPTLNALGGVLQALGENDAAHAALTRAIALKPDYVEALTNLGLLLQARGDVAAALPLFDKVVALAPTLAEAHLNRGLALHAARRLDEAVSSLERSVRLKPQLAAAWNTLGIAQATRGAFTESCDALARATALAPKQAEYLSHFGLSLQKAGRGDEALAVLDRAVAADPKDADAIFNRGVVRNQTGDFAGALADWKATIAAHAGHRAAWSNLIFALHYEPDSDGASLRREAAAFERLHGNPPGRHTSWPNPREPERRLRIGYVSPDFREHSVAHYMEPLLAAHDRAAVEVFAYAELKRSDAATERLKARVDHWSVTAGMRDEDIARRIRDDGIDFLVDLAGHSADNRLGVFALKPAPVQVTWLGFPGTTGLSAIDYRMTDAAADPPGSDAWSSETLVRLPHGFHCWRPPADAPPVAARTSAGAPVFGSFNNVQKISTATVAAWAAILQRIPEATLSLKSSWLSRQRAVANLREAFAAQGIDPARIAMSGWIDGTAKHLAAYGEIDVGLDPFPYNGTTTTLEALWMGVPVVALAGDRHSARVGVSLLQQVGLTETIALSVEDYIEKAVALAADRERLAVWRTRSRERMSASPLLDAAGFARIIEESYRAMWRRWCGA
jgi:predicted O-linked N-acetylglucosamine transferase (SPINDLY family)